MPTPPLKLLQVDVTEECPLFCAHCSNDSGPTHIAHFPIRRLVGIIDEAKDLGLERVVFSGGEPLRYPHLSGALSAAKAAGVAATIFTTGIRDKTTRLPISVADWRELAEAGLVSAAFSIYASRSHRQYHNDIVRLRPRQGDAFGVNEQAIRNARLAEVSVDVHFIPSALTVDELPDIYSWASELRCSVLHLQIPTLQGRNKQETSIQLDSRAEARLQKAALDLLRRADTTKLYVSRFWSFRWNSPADSRCVANLEQLVIRTDGTISPCNACKYGSVTLESENTLAEGTSLETIWRNSRVLRQVRDTRPQGSPQCCEGLLAVPPRIKLLNRAVG